MIDDIDPLLDKPATQNLMDLVDNTRWPKSSMALGTIAKFLVPTRPPAIMDVEWIEGMGKSGYRPPTIVIDSCMDLPMRERMECALCERGFPVASAGTVAYDEGHKLDIPEQLKMLLYQEKATSFKDVNYKAQPNRKARRTKAAKARKQSAKKRRT